MFARSFAAARSRAQAVSARAALFEGCVAAQARGFAAPGRDEANMNELYMRAVEPKPPERTRPSPADISRGHHLSLLATKLLWKRNRVQMRDLNRKTKLKWAAIGALPTEELRREALVIDPYIPFNVRIARVTPPLSGFHSPEEKERERLAAEAAAAHVAKQQAAAGGAGGAAGEAGATEGGVAVEQVEAAAGGAAAGAKGGKAGKKGKSGNRDKRGSIYRDADIIDMSALYMTPLPSSLPGAPPAAPSGKKK